LLWTEIQCLLGKRERKDTLHYSLFWWDMTSRQKSIAQTIAQKISN
jgi:hypothetical protein